MDREGYGWPDETVLRGFTIMATTPNADMDELQDRMPVILDQADWPVWLGELRLTCQRSLRETRTAASIPLH